MAKKFNRFAIIGGEVVSQKDGDHHSVGPNELRNLYGINPNHCILFRNIDHFLQYNKTGLTFYRLPPRRDGDYDLLYKVNNDGSLEVTHP